MSQPTGAHLQLSWACIQNGLEGDRFEAELTLANHGDQPLGDSGWAIYFNTLRKVQAGSVGGGADITHVGGNLYRLAPTADFGTLAPGQARTIRYVGMLWVLQEGDAPVGCYIVHGDGTPAARAEAIGDARVVPFERPETRNRNAHDKVPPASAASRHAANAGLSLLPAEAVGRITPTPRSARFDGGHYFVSADTLIVHPPELAAEAALLHQSLADLLGRAPQRAAAGPGIALRLGPVGEAGGDSAEAYRLSIAADGVEIVGASPHGVCNGIQSLRQLLPIEAFLNPQAVLALPCGEVIDAPRFGYRGLHLDVSRNFASKETVLRLLECMALYKLNRFHFHLTDDEGWRLEIPSLPELTEYGSRRGFSVDEADCLQPSFGSGADAAAPSGSGHYSRADFVEILRFAAQRHIEVIPEFDVPGHARAAIRAMRLRHDRLLAAGRREEAERYLLDDPDDASQYESVQCWRGNVICIAREGAYAFIDTVIADVKAMYAEAGAPWRRLHIGGDEVPRGVWEGSPLCRRFMAEHGLADVEALHMHFRRRYLDIIRGHGLAAGGWEEVALHRVEIGGALRHTPNLDFGDRDFLLYIWNDVSDWGQQDFAYRLANAGYPVVLGNATHLYFDLAYEKDPAEPGFYWAGFIDTRRAFEFCPFDLFANGATGLLGDDLSEAVRDKAKLSAAGQRQVHGLQGHLWSESARSRALLEHLAMPRLIALAERAWAADPGWADLADPAERAAAMAHDWNAFANRLGQRELPRLDGLVGGYGYRIPVPGAAVIDGVLHASIELPGFTVRYSPGGGEPTPRSPEYLGPVPVHGPVTVAAFSSSNRRGRSVTVA